MKKDKIAIIANCLSVIGFALLASVGWRTAVGVLFAEIATALYILKNSLHE